MLSSGTSIVIISIFCDDIFGYFIVVLDSLCSRSRHAGTIDVDCITTLKVILIGIVVCLELIRTLRIFIKNTGNCVLLTMYTL